MTFATQSRSEKARECARNYQVFLDLKIRAYIYKRRGSDGDSLPLTANYIIATLRLMHTHAIYTIMLSRLAEKRTSAHNCSPMTFVVYICPNHI